MKIIIDADASPVISIVENIAAKHHIEVILVCDHTHNINSNNQVIYVDKGHDSADFKIINLTKKHDIVITQDYALASLCLDKDAIVIHNNGFIIDKNNIDTLLQTRYINQKARKMNKKIPNIKKRSSDDDNNFKISLINIIKQRRKSQNN